MFNDSIENPEEVRKLLDVIFLKSQWDTYGEDIDIQEIKIGQPEYDADTCYATGYSYEYNVNALIKFKGELNSINLKFPKVVDDNVIFNKAGLPAKPRVLTKIGIVNRVIMSRKYTCCLTLENIWLRPMEGTFSKDRVKYNLMSIPGIDKNMISEKFYGKPYVPEEDTTPESDESDEQEETDNDELTVDTESSDLFEGPDESKDIKLDYDSLVTSAVDDSQGDIRDDFDYQNYKFDERTLLRLRTITRKDYSKASFGEVLNDIIKYIDTPELDDLTMLDIHFKDVFEGLKSELQAAKAKIRSDIFRKYRKYHKLNVTYLQSCIYSYFRGKALNEDQTQYSGDSNPLANIGTANKIYIYEIKNNTKTKITLKYNEALFGVICPIKSQEGPQINKKNELSIGTTFINGELNIKVYEKGTMNLVLLKPQDYLKAKVLCSENWDYDQNKIIPIDGKISVCYLGKIMLYTDPNEFEYIHMMNGEFGYAVANIPMCNSTDTVRSMLGAHMADQAIPVVGKDRAIIYTGTEVVKPRGPQTGISGTVKKITDEYTVIEDADGNRDVIKRPITRESVNHSYNMYESSVKVGDKVQEGDQLYHQNSFIGNEFSVGINAVMGYVHTGYDYEDGIAVRRGYIEKFAHPIEVSIKVYVPLNNAMFDKNMTFINENKIFDKNLDEYGVIIPGTEVQARDALIGFTTEVRKGLLSDAAAILKAGSMARTSDITKVPTYIRKGTVTKIVLYDDNNLAPEGLRKYNYKILNSKEDTELYIKPPFDETEYMYAFEFFIKYMNVPKIGDKFTNEFGSKGTITHIFEDSEMYRIGGKDGELIDAIASPASTIGRKGLSQIKQAFLGNVSKKFWNEVYNQIKDYDPNTGFGNENLLKEWKDKLGILVQSDLYKNYSFKQFYDLVMSTKDIKAFRIKMKSIETRFTYEVMSKISEVFQVDMSCKVPVWFNGRLLDNEIVVGYGRLMRLHFIVENKATATAVNKRFKVPILGGKDKSEGQKIGEQEVWALCSYGLWHFQELLETTNNDKGDDLVIQLLLLGQGIEEVPD